MVEFLSKKSVYVLFFLIVIVASGFAMAGFNLGEPEYEINDVYGKGFNLSGWVNISFNSQPLNSNIQDSFGNSITLKDFLDANPSYNYNCNPEDCGNDYYSSNSETTKVISVNSNDEKLLGFELQGEISSINSVYFEIQSDNTQSSCKNHIKLDILNDELIEVQNNKTSSETCDEKNYGCFLTSQSTEEYNLISGATYCQKINLSEAPSIETGAWIKPVDASETAKMELYDKYGYKLGDCNLPTINSSGEHSCEIKEKINSGEYFVCIYYGSGSGSYKIKGYSNSNKCGFFGKPVKSETASYQIFAQGKKFSPPGTLKIQNKLQDGRIVSNIIQDYLIEKYKTTGGMINCTNKCIVPMKIISGANQQITLKNLEIIYEKQTGILTETKFHDLNEIPAKLNSDKNKLYLEKAGFKLPTEKGTYNLTLKIDKDKILNKTIEIKDAPIIKSLLPIQTASAFPTEFEVEIQGDNITSYTWDFGDNLTETTFKNKITHTYFSTGIYNLKIKVKDIKEIESEKTFEINVTSPKNLIETKLNELDSNIENIKNQTQKLGIFYEQGISEVLNLDETETKLNILRTEFESAQTEEEYNSIVNNIININVPKNIVETEKAQDFTFIPYKEDIKIDALSSITGESYDNSNYERYQDAIIAWNQENLNIKLDFRKFSVETIQTETQSSLTPFIGFFELEIDERKSVSENYFLIIPELNGIEFQGNAETNQGYYYIDLSNKEKIIFYTTEEINFIELPAFISPSINSLSIREEIIPDSENKTGILVIALILLLIIGISSYILLQQWYKNKYENYLFENRNDLYNMVHYVNKAKKKGLNKKEIRKNLKKAGWDLEKINYVMKKYAGKRTGMLEIPIDKIISLFGKKSPAKNYSKKDMQHHGKKSSIKAPLGIKIISIFYYIQGIFLIFGGIFIIFIGEVLSSLLSQVFPNSALSFGGIFIAISIFLMGLGTVIIIIGRKLKNKKRWAKIVVTILALLGVILGIYLTLQNWTYIFTTFINLAITGYLLLNQNAKKFFRK